MRHAAKGPPFHSGPLATYRNGPVSSNVRRQRRRVLHHLKAVALLIALTCLFNIDAKAQRSVPGVIQNCENALSNFGARDAMPLFNSRAVREAICICINAGAPIGVEDISAQEVAESMQSAVATCTGRTVPAAEVKTLPVAVLLSLHDALRAPIAQRIFVDPSITFIDCERPEYPVAALRVEASGDTKLAIKVSDTGKVLDGVVVGSAGPTPAHKILDVTALLSLMQCKLEPAYWRSKAIEAWAMIEYRWRLN